MKPVGLALAFFLALVLLSLPSTALAAPQVSVSVSPDTFYVYPAGARLEAGRLARIPSGGSNYYFGEGGQSVWFDYDSSIKGECQKSFFDYRLTSGFGLRNNPTSSARELKMHYGVDYAMPVGTSVCAARGGTVVQVASGWNGGFGTQVVVQAADGSCDSYNHLSAYGVREGDRISAGNLIAKSGNTGSSTGPHLHFGRSSKCVIGGRYSSGRYVNPLGYRYA